MQTLPSREDLIDPQGVGGRNPSDLGTRETAPWSFFYDREMEGRGYLHF
jgi:hypothetical protein